MSEAGVGDEHSSKETRWQGNMLTQVLVNVLNLNVRSIASPLEARVHLPPFVDNRGLTACLRESTSDPLEKAGSILVVVYGRVSGLQNMR